jgi:hypothetical protein
VVLVNGFDAWVETAGGFFFLSSQLYNPDVMHPDSGGSAWRGVEHSVTEMDLAEQQA